MFAKKTHTQQRGNLIISSSAPSVVFVHDLLWTEGRSERGVPRLMSSDRIINSQTRKRRFSNMLGSETTQADVRSDIKDEH